MQNKDIQANCVDTINPVLSPVDAWKMAIGISMVWATRTAVRATTTVFLWCERARTRQALARLDQRLLKDVALSAEDAAREASKPFWKA